MGSLVHEVRWLALLAACLAILGLVVGFTTTRGGSQTDARRPVLKLERSIPLTVRGLRFHARERVRVSAGARAARATAGSSGTFVVTIPARRPATPFGSSHVGRREATPS
jgi:hypothetical protein